MSQFDLCFNTKSRASLPFNSNNLEQLKRFREDNPHIIGNFIPQGTPFILRTPQSGDMSDFRRSRPDIACALDNTVSWPEHTKRNVSTIVNNFGDEDALAIAALYDAEISPYVDKVRGLTSQQVLGRNLDTLTATGAALTSLESSQVRLSTFGKAILKYQTSLIEIRKASQNKQPKLELIKLGNKAKQAHLELNTVFKREMVKFKGKVKASARGNIWSNAQRGIDTARSARSSAPLQLTSLANIQHLRKLEQGSNIAGKFVIAIDAGLRADSVYDDYKAGKDWQRSAVREATGFGLGTAAGAYVGGTTITAGVGIAIAMGPVGWVILIGVGLGAGYAAAKVGDAVGKGFSGLVYDLSSNISWF
ncbi:MULTISPECIES: hypothetical protein [unclassified Pseudoalteromonas]|uniref:hypothetical protein n=1 Tax=unclassified Pseudoalteromonas TaxID=194690 RepID=UPI001C4AF22E|nr:MULTISPECIES: hypothetical protein [unclassified Pseudoalteromonas]